MGGLTQRQTEGVAIDCVRGAFVRVLGERKDQDVPAAIQLFQLAVSRSHSCAATRGRAAPVTVFLANKGAVPTAQKLANA